MELKKFYYIEYPDNYLVLHGKNYPEQDGVTVLWFNRGLYGLVHPAAIKNLKQQMRDLNLAAPGNAKIPGVFWDEVLDVPPDVARYLLSEILEDKNQQSNGSSSSDAQ